MSTRKVCFVTALGVLLYGVATMAATVPASAANLRFQAPYSSSQIQSVEILKPWADDFAVKSGGKLVVNFFPNASIVQNAEAGRAIINGLLDIGPVGSVHFPKEAPYLFMTNLPFLVKSSQHGTALLYTLQDAMPEMKAEMEKKGHTLAMWTSALYGFSSTSVPVRSPADLKDRRILIIIPGDSAMIEAWGGIPVFVPSSDAYVGLQRGMGEILYTALPMQKGLRITELAKYVTPLASSSVAMGMTMNTELYNDLPDDQKKLFDESSGRALSERVAASLDRDTGEVLKTFQEFGAEVITLTPEEEEVFQAGLQSLLEGYWVKTAKDIGIKGDPKILIEKYYSIADSVPDPNKK